MGENVKLSKGFILGSLLGGAILATILYIAGLAVIMSTEEVFPGALLIVLGALAAIFATVVMCIIVYRMWKAIQDGYARTTPGKAVGFLFIPFFNFYWIFQAYWGFSKDYNAYIERHSIATDRLPEGLFLAYAILSLSGMVPYIGMLVGIASFIIFIILVVKICDAVNALPTAAEAVSTNEVGGQQV